jgi:hypothetical protein
MNQVEVEDHTVAQSRLPAVVVGHAAFSTGNRRRSGVRIPSAPQTMTGDRPRSTCGQWDGVPVFRVRGFGTRALSNTMMLS